MPKRCADLSISIHTSSHPRYSSLGEAIATHAQFIACAILHGSSIRMSAAVHTPSEQQANTLSRDRDHARTTPFSAA